MTGETRNLASYTSPMPPRPSKRSIRYGPTLWPGTGRDAFGAPCGQSSVGNIVGCVSLNTDYMSVGGLGGVSI